MSTPNDKLASSLDALRELQQEGRRVFRSSEFSRLDRERLLRAGFLQDVVKGWIMSSSPGTHDGDSTPWYASFWEFCARYCNERFGADWHLSAEQSFLIHGASTAIPAQLVVNSPRGANNTLNLPFDTSIFDVRASTMPARADLVEREGLRLYSLAAALVKVPEAAFRRHPVEARVALASATGDNALLRRLLDGGHTEAAGRLAGAYRRGGRADIADEILGAMRAAHFDVREVDPFATVRGSSTLRGGASPIVERLRVMWEASRASVLKAFPRAPGLPRSRTQYLKRVDEVYVTDAYHSLSIEGYQVSPELIERVRTGRWNPKRHPEDQKDRDALAARGYWDAFKQVKKSVNEILGGKNPGACVRGAHGAWYRALFGPCVTAGLISPGALAGYRNDAVYLRGSRHVPVRWEVVREAMSELFSLLEQEPEPSVRAVLGHWLLGYIHPYPDGNGRMARFLMNAMLASGGYPWTVVRLESRAAYLGALDRASLDVDVGGIL